MEFVFSNSVIKVKTILSTAPESGADIIISEERNFDRKSIVEVREGNSITRVVLFWSHFSDDALPSLHWSEARRVLFIGAGCVSAVVDISKTDLININYPDLFWGWECVENNILEMCELDCRLYSPSGKLIGHAHVDPPYDYRVTDKAIIFSSIVVGKTSIELK